MKTLFGATVVLITSTVVACKSTPEPTRYFVTTEPIVPVGNGLCVGVDPSDPHGVWWWDVGRSGCSSRSSSVMHPGDAVASATDGALDVRFSVGLISAPPEPQSRAVHMIFKGESVTLVDAEKPVTTGVLRRSDLDLSNEPCPCP
jgi:hypothetical protein